MNDLIDTKSQFDDTETNYESKSNLNVNLDSDDENNCYLIDDIFNKPSDTQKKSSELANKVVSDSLIADKTSKNDLKKEISPNSNISNQEVQNEKQDDEKKKPKKFRSLAKSFKWISRKPVKQQFERQNSLNDPIGQRIILNSLRI